MMTFTASDFFVGFVTLIAIIHDCLPLERDRRYWASINTHGQCHHVIHNGSITLLLSCQAQTIMPVGHIFFL